jgi:hypothetical protein
MEAWRQRQTKRGGVITDSSSTRFTGAREKISLGFCDAGLCSTLVRHHQQVPRERAPQKEKVHLPSPAVVSGQDKRQLGLLDF